MTDLPIMRQSERGDFKQCVQKWVWRWNDWLVPQMPNFGALWFGTMWHLLWATVYTPPAGADGFTRAITRPSEIHALWDELLGDVYTTVSGQPFWGDDQEFEWNDAKTLGHLMIDGQLSEWKLDPAWEILGPEKRFSTLVPYNGYQTQVIYDHGELFKDSPFGPHITRLVGTYDLPIRDHTDEGTPKCKVVD